MHQGFPDAKFTPTVAVVATWENVAAYEEQTRTTGPSSKVRGGADPSSSRYVMDRVVRETQSQIPGGRASLALSLGRGGVHL